MEKYKGYVWNTFLLFMFMMAHLFLLWDKVYNEGQHVNIFKITFWFGLEPNVEWGVPPWPLKLNVFHFLFIGVSCMTVGYDPDPGSSSAILRFSCQHLHGLKSEESLTRVIDTAKVIMHGNHLSIVLRGSSKNPWPEWHIMLGSKVT